KESAASSRDTCDSLCHFSTKSPGSGAGGWLGNGSFPVPPQAVHASIALGSVGCAAARRSSSRVSTSLAAARQSAVSNASSVLSSPGSYHLAAIGVSFLGAQRDDALALENNRVCRLPTLDAPFVVEPIAPNPAMK